jgi:hypothetical protein
MEIMTFNRHTQMNDNTREEILDLITDLQITENCNQRSMINYLYGLFDGYDYSDLILSDPLLQELNNGGNKHITDRITLIAYTIKGYEKN